MPGLIGLVGNCAMPQSASSAATSISHFDEYCSKQSSPFGGLEIAQVWRNPNEIAGSWQQDDASGVSAFINGTIIKSDGTPRQIDADEILQAYLRDDLRPDQYDGSFIIVISDSRTRQLIVCNDRLGTLPCYYYSDSHCFCFAPEAKAIFAALRMTPEYSINGLISFLAIGHCLAETTLFESIRFLEPASRLVIDVPSVTYTLTRYWHMQYQPSARYRSRRKAEEDLYEAILSGHRSVFANPCESYDLLLSGGWDSRCMLASGHALGHMPQRSVSWGLRDDLPGSDPFLAAQLARQYGVKHHFIAYDTDAFIENAVEWSYLTELNTDNFGWYGEGDTTLLNNYASNADYLLRGDEGWGQRKHARNKEEAMAACHMPEIASSSLARCLSKKLAIDQSGIYLAEIDKTLSLCDNKDYNDRKDFLYLHGRVARFIFSLGYYKELVVEVRRPFFCKHVLDVVQQLPVRLRYWKNLYISMLIRFFPELLNVNECGANSLPQWRRDLREKPELSRYFAGLLTVNSLAQTTFAEHLNLPEIEAVSRKFFATPYKETPAVPRSSRQSRISQSLKHRLTARDDIWLGLHLKKPMRLAYDEFDLLRRLALLVLLDRNLARFSG